MDHAAAAQLADEVMLEAPEIRTVPGIAYGVLHDGSLVHVAGRGEAFLGGPAPDADTVFRIASMTKSFTAATVLSLRDEGLLRLDDPLTQYLPAATGIGSLDGPSITVRDLLTMGAGLATDDPWGDRQESLPVADFDALVSYGLSFCRPPRMAFEYSNTGYALLGRVIEMVTGQRYTDVVIERICRPLGMTSSRFDAREIERLATGYRISADGEAIPEPLVLPGTYSAMGGLHSTISDLSRWVAGFLASWHDDAATHPVDRWSLREAQELARYAGMESTPDGTIVHGYGFGLMVEEHERLGRVVSHSGGYPGFGSHMRWHPSSGWAVIALGNATYAPMRTPAIRLLSRLVTESQSSHGAKPPMPVTPWPQTVAAMDVAERMFHGSDVLVSEENWSPNMDLDVPRTERMLLLANVRDGVGAAVRDVSSVAFSTPARVTWTVVGDSGAATLEVLMTPEKTPRMQKLTAGRAKD